MRLWRLVVLIFGLMSPSFFADAATYRHAEYGFSVKIAARQPTCTGEPYEHSHGIDVFLDGGPAVCGHLDERPFISVIGEYRRVDDYKPPHVPSPQEAAEWYCKIDNRPLIPPPELLRIGKRGSGSCRIDHDGWIEIIVATIAWVTVDKEDRDNTRWIEYSVELQTTPAHFDHDLVQLRAILKSIRIFRPDDN